MQLFSNITVDKSGDSDGGDTSNFYGNNSAILAKSGANLTINTSGTVQKCLIFCVIFCQIEIFAFYIAQKKWLP